MFRILATILLLWHCCVGNPVVAQEVPSIRHFSPFDYAGQSQNWALTQSGEGNYYVGNNGGLLEFDGAKWQHYDLPERQIIRAVATGKDGMIFCGGFAEFGYWKKDDNGQLNYHSLSQRIQSDLLAKEEIWHIVVAPEAVFFQSFSTIYKFDYQKVSSIKPPNSIMFAQWVNEKLLLPVIAKGLYELDAGNTFRFLPGSEALKDEIIQFLVPNGIGGVWAGTTNNGIFEWQDGRCRPMTNPLNERFKRSQLNRALALKNGGWAIGTILDGVFLLDIDGQIRHHLNRECGLQNNTVLALSEDQLGNLWVGLDSGIDYVQLNSPLTFFSDQTGKTGTVYAAKQIGERLYIGTNHGVFSGYRIAQTKFGDQNAGFQLINGTQGQVWQLQVFDNQLICGHNSGTFRIDGNEAVKISDITGGWCTLNIPGQRDYLIQSTYTGLILFHKNGAGRWQYLCRIADFKEPLKKICFDEAGNLWGVHPNRGLYRLRLSDDFQRVSEYQYFTRAEGLPADFHLDLMTRNGQLYLNAQDQVMRIRSSGKQALFEAVADFEPSQKCIVAADSTCFGIDKSGIWILEGKNRERISRNLHLVPDFEQIAALPQQHYLFCLENGYAILDKAALTEQRQKSRAIAPRISSLSSPQDVHFSLLEKLELPSKQNNLKFGFSMPFFEHQPNFSWQLKGYAEGWSDWQTEPFKEFTNLPPGQYTFLLRSDLSDQIASLDFVIRVPWYRSWWMFLLYGLLFLSAMYALELWYDKRMAKQRLRLEADKVQALEQQRHDAEREKLRLEIENRNRELSNAAFNLIRKNEALQNLKDELMETRGDVATARKIARHIDEHLEADHDWSLFEESFNRVHDDFFKRMLAEFPELSTGDLRLAAYLKMNLSSKEIAPLLNIGVRGVENKRYRLRKKLGLSESANLAEFILKY